MLPSDIFRRESLEAEAVSQHNTCFHIRILMRWVFDNSPKLQPKPTTVKPFLFGFRTSNICFAAAKYSDDGGSLKKSPSARDSAAKRNSRPLLKKIELFIVNTANNANDQASQKPAELKITPISFDEPKEPTIIGLGRAPKKGGFFVVF